MLRRASEALAPLALGVALAVLAAGCAPSCEAVCRKARKCDVAPRLSQDECVESCERQDVYYDLLDDKDLKEEYAAHRRCIGQATCDEIQAGECYDEDLFIF